MVLVFSFSIWFRAFNCGTPSLVHIIARVNLVLYGQASFSCNFIILAFYQLYLPKETKVYFVATMQLLQDLVCIIKNGDYGKAQKLIYFRKYIS